MWTLYNDQGKLSEEPFSEEMARALIEQDMSGTVYAENEGGDFIETHDGPINVGALGKWYVVDSTDQPVASRVTEESARTFLEKRPDLRAKCPATNESITKFDGVKAVDLASES